MKMEVLISTMHQTDISLLDKMHIKTDCVVINQCNRNQIEEIEHNGCRVKWFSLCDRGVGLSRNTALMHSTADILLFADDDVVYEDNYEKKVLEAFEKYPEADLIVFNLASLNPERPETIILSDHRLHWHNCLKYGACRIAVRRQAVLNNNVFYSLLFGGGAKYQAGEDNLFITQCLQHGMKGIASATTIGTVKQEESTWFHGYNKKYYHDRGALFAAMYGKWAGIVILLFEMKLIFKRKGQHILTQLQYEFEGIKEYRSSVIINKI